MWDIRRAKLQGNRVANLLSNMDGFRAVAGDPCRQRLHAVTAENGLYLMRVERGRPLFDSLLQQSVDVDGIRSQVTW